MELECYKCHEVKGESLPTVAETEKGIGPELSQMAGMHPPEFFAESIVNPNAVIDPEDKDPLDRRVLNTSERVSLVLMESLACPHIVRC